MFSLYCLSMDCVLDYRVCTDDITIFTVFEFNTTSVANILLLKGVIGKVFIMQLTVSFQVEKSKAQCVFVSNLNHIFREFLLRCRYHGVNIDTVKQPNEVWYQLHFFFTFYSHNLSHFVNFWLFFTKTHKNNYKFMLDNQKKGKFMQTCIRIE